MKAFAVLILLVSAFVGGTFGQTPELEQPPNLQIAKFDWSKERIAWEGNPHVVPLETVNETRTRIRDERRQRSALEERSMRSAEEEKKRPSKPPRYVFYYRLQVQNSSTKAIKEIDWDYIFTDAITGDLLGRLEFTSIDKVGAGKKRELIVRVSSPPTHSISVHTLGKDEQAGIVGKVAVRRILYEDASVWTASQ